jgi:hypothetical protein
LAAGGQNAPVGQQQSNRVVASKNCQARHRCPCASCWIPQLTRVRWIARGIACGLSCSASAGYQHCAVRKQCSVVKFASPRHHRSSILPRGVRTIQVDDLCSLRWIGGATRVKSTWASAHKQYLAIVVHHCRSPVTSPVVAIPHHTPVTSAGAIKVSGCLTRPRTEHLAIRRNKHEWIERQRQVRCGQVAPGLRCTLPYLRLHIDTHRRIGPATDHQHVSVRQRGARRIPSPVIHIRQPGPGIVQPVIRVGIRQPHKILYVSTGYQKLSIRQKRMA